MKNKELLQAVLCNCPIPITLNRIFLYSIGTLTLTLALTVAVFANGFSQSEKIELSVQNAKLSTILPLIEQKGKIRLMYGEEVNRIEKRITIAVDNTPALEVLEYVLKHTDLEYVPRENNLVIIRKRSVSQPRPIRGVVRNAAGEPLNGVSVSVKGGANGIATDNQGAYVIEANGDGTLVFSYMGYITQEVAVNARTTVDVVLDTEEQELGEVVVTALGVSRQKKSLGYSVTEVKGASLTQARETNVASSLVGKVAGVNVSTVSGGAGSSANIQIRGMSSLSQSNQPLYVINGVPMTNETAVGRGQFHNTPDRGDAIGNINPDDIESINVLKGAAASALYGSRAKGGVILITTKSGKVGAPASIEFSSNFVVNQVMDMTDWQYEYGQGTTSFVNGGIVQARPTSALEAQNSATSSWGPRIDGGRYVQSDGIERPYAAAKNNVSDFYGMGGTWTNTVAFSKGFESGAIRFSASDLDNSGIMPNNTLNRRTFNLSSTLNVNKRLKLDVMANYVTERAANRPKLGDLTMNANHALAQYANTINLLDFKGDGRDADGNEERITSNAYIANPWFAAENYENETDRDRLLSAITLNYQLANGFFLQGRLANDVYTDKYKQIIPWGTGYAPRGELNEQQTKFNEINADVLIGRDFDLGDDMALSVNLGSSIRDVRSDSYQVSGSGFTIPYVYYLNNLPARVVNYALYREQMQAVYGTVEFEFKDMFFLTGTARNDWFSTLATPDNSNPVHKFYPSISGSFVFSELLDWSWLNFGKLRAGYAEVGQATTAFQTALNYDLLPVTAGQNALGTIVGQNVPNRFLKPSVASELEIGYEVRLFDGRLAIDMAWYDKQSRNEIVNTPISSTTGYLDAALNIGQLRNRGLEALVTVVPVRTEAGFRWQTSVNGTLNNNEVIALSPQSDSFTWAIGRRNTAFIQHIVGLPAGQVVAYDYAKDEDGQPIVNANTGLPEPSTTLTPMGSAYHRWIVGWDNDFTFKNAYVSFLVDGKFGGKIFSETEAGSYLSGKSKRTLEGREEIFGNNQTAMQYYAALNRVSSLFVQDASFIRFRQLVIGYNFPNDLFNGAVKGLGVSLVGRNLFTLMRRTRNIDPESAYSGEAVGLEMGLLPPQRTFGFNLKFNL